MFVLLGLHVLLALAAPPLARRLGRGVLLVSALAPGATVAWAATQAPAILGGQPLTHTLAWAPSLGVDVTLRLDALGLLMVTLVSGIGALIFLYAYGYFTKPEPKLGSFTGALVGFSGSMLGLVLADNLLAVFVFWELTSITSYLLIGHKDTDHDSRDAAQQALLVTGVGGLALLGGVVMIGQATGTYSMAELAATSVGSSPLLDAGVLLVLLGAFTKSAQAPFHTWLPGAMAAPTPVSAYLHSATMVKAGVYLVARLAPIFAAVSVPWRPAVILVGLATMLVGGYRALRQHDLKLLLAFGTVSQLGFLMVLFGAGVPKATFGGAALILAHGLFKATLFMVVGAVDKQAGTRDLRRLHGLAQRMPVVVAAGAVSAASMAGLPPLLGFISKEAAYEAVLLGGFGGLVLLALIGVVAGSVLTFAYSARFVAGLLGRFAGQGGQTPVDTALVERPSWALGAPVALLAVLSVLLGLAPLLADSVVNQAVGALHPGWEAVQLRLWHGFNLALGLSALTVAAGTALYLLRDRVAAGQQALPAPPDSKATYDAAVRGVLAGAKRLTAVVQNGSLPVYMTVILLTLLILPGAGLVASLPGLELPDIPQSPAQAVTGAGLVAAALATVVARRRFVAVLLLGAVGFGVGLLFVLQGAPDLALTQFVVETLALVIFVLVLRHLPDRFTRARDPLKVVRGAFAAAVGLFVFGFALVAGAARTAAPVSTEYLVRAVPEAEGRNVVNVILVDFRALDTLGEVIVIAVAAMGISSLILASRLDRRAPLEPGAQPSSEVDHERLK